MCSNEYKNMDAFMEKTELSVQMSRGIKIFNELLFLFNGVLQLFSISPLESWGISEWAKAIQQSLRYTDF